MIVGADHGGLIIEGVYQDHYVYGREALRQDIQGEKKKI